MRHCDKGTFIKLNDFLRGKSRTASGRKAELSTAIIDCQSVRTVQEINRCGYDAEGKNEGS